MKVRCLDHVDGTLADAGFSALVDEVAQVICEFRPDIVITFGPDGGYGHPDHVTISAATTAACQRAAVPGRRPDRTVAQPSRLYYRCFPQGDLLIMERLAVWLATQPDRFAGTPAFAHALLVLAEAASTMGHIRNHVQVRWYPPGSYVVEQGEVAAELFLILSGEAQVRHEGEGGRRERRGRLGVGQFFGHRHRSADVVAATDLTCLVLSPAPPAKFAGRGPGARLAGALPGTPATASPAAGHVPGRSGHRLLRRVRAGHAQGRSPVRLPQPVPAGTAHVPRVPAPGDLRLRILRGRRYRPARSSGRGAPA